MSAPTSIFTASLIVPAIGDSFKKLDPRQLIKNPVMFTTAVVATLLTLLLIIGGEPLSFGFQLQLIVWLWLTVLFGTFAEALAEGRGRAQAASLRATKADLKAKRLLGVGETYEIAFATLLEKGDIVLVETGDLIPADGEVVEGVASVNEAAITGESAPVIREAGGDRSAVTAGTRVISDRIKVRITQEPGHGFLDRMIALVEGAERQKTPNEIALTILLVGLTIIFLIAVATIPGFAMYAGGGVPVAILAALLITLIPTTIAALLSAIGIAGMDRLVRFNVLAKSGRAVEAAGDIDVLLLDKTGTITIGDRQASQFFPVGGIDVDTLASAASLASIADETPEGRSIVVLARERHAVATRTMPADAEIIPFTAQTRVSGIKTGASIIRKGAVDAILRTEPGLGDTPVAAELRRVTEEIARSGATPLAVSRDGRLLGAIALKDVVKAGIRERFGELRQMGIRTVMITGDNPLTAAAIAEEAGVDGFLAEATPEDKMALIKSEQAGCNLVAMTG
ncbi:MAG: potassium-transporting ATPase subunit, partial [Sphingomonas bacterium]|uniref:potassium-transporting ATPase subunit KdpB n=1 Tax=Sphingomonas bacterium TaxID=1895847 RepID=UPI00261889F7